MFRILDKEGKTNPHLFSAHLELRFLWVLQEYFVRYPKTPL